MISWRYGGNISAKFSINRVTIPVRWSGKVEGPLREITKKEVKAALERMEKAGKEAEPTGVKSDMLQGYQPPISKVRYSEGPLL